MSEAAELARELAANDRTVRRAVSRGMIRGRRPSPNKLEIPEDEREYLAAHWDLLQKLVAALRTEPSVRTAILYGSAARGDDTDASDVDLIVQWRPGARTQPRDLSLRLERAIGREVEIVSLDQAEHEPRFLLDVLQDGRPIVDRDQQWHRLRNRSAVVGREARRRREERDEAAANTWATLSG